MGQKDLWVAGVAVLAINLIANLGIFVKFSDMANYAVAKETYQQNAETLSQRLTNIESQLSETNKDIKLILRYYKQ